MAYTPNNLLTLQGAIGGVTRLWAYWSADSIATITGGSYISDATNKRMQVGDIVLVFSGTLNTTGPNQVPSTHSRGTVSEFASAPSFAICEVSSISSGAATLTTAALVSESFASPTLTGVVKIAGATDTVGFYAASPATQPSGAAQASVVTTAAQAISSGFGFATSDQLNSLVSLTNALRAALVTLGLIKGSS